MGYGGDVGRRVTGPLHAPQAGAVCLLQCHMSIDSDPPPAVCPHPRRLLHTSTARASSAPAAQPQTRRADIGEIGHKHTRAIRPFWSRGNRWAFTHPHTYTPPPSLQSWPTACPHTLPRRLPGQAVCAIRSLLSSMSVGVDSVHRTLSPLIRSLSKPSSPCHKASSLIPPPPPLNRRKAI